MIVIIPLINNKLGSEVWEKAVIVLTQANERVRFPTAIESWKASVFVRNVVHMPACAKA